MPTQSLTCSFNDASKPYPAIPENSGSLPYFTPGGSIQNDGSSCRDSLVLQHLALVEAVARRIHRKLPQSVELADLVSAGMLGLLDAAGRFDAKKQVQFKSYAQFRIRGAILDSLRILDWSPRELRRQGRAVADAVASLGKVLGRTPSDAETADALGMDLNQFQLLQGRLGSAKLGSLNEERSEECDGEELDFLAAPADDNPLTRCIAAQTQAQLASAIETLTERERFVITCYYLEGMTLREIGLALGVVESRISQIRTAAVNRLRRVMVSTDQTGAHCSQGRLVH